MKKIISMIIAGTMLIATIPIISAYTSVNLNDKNITDERLLEMVENGNIPNDVDWLQLEKNKIIKFTALSSLTDLRNLFLSDNQINDITALSDLKELEWLYLHNNQINDISPLCNLIKMRCLTAHNNQIDDLTPLIQLKKLNILFFGENQINDIAPLSYLTDLNTLVLNNNQIIDISPLRDLVNLNGMFLHDNQISDLSPLYDLKNLQILTLNNNPIDESHIIELKSHLPNCIIEYTPTPGHVLGNIDVTIFDGIEILKYLVGIESVIDDSKVALEAAMLTAESKARGEPTIFDFVEILLILVDM